MNIAIVGCGQISDAHANEINRLKLGRIVAVCDLNLHLAKQFSVRFNIDNYYTNIFDMFKEVKPDVVHINTPVTSHLELAKICLNFNSHLYIEKPFSVNLLEAKEIVRIAQKCGKLVCAGHNSLFDPSYQRLLLLNRNKKLGEIVHIDAFMGYNLDGPFGKIFMGDPTHWLHSLPGGLAQNNISHPISLILGLMTGELDNISAWGYRFRNETFNDVRDKFYDEIRATIVSNKITANLVFSSRMRPLQTSINVYGTKTAATVNLESRTLKITYGANLPGPFAKVQWAGKDTKESAREFFYNLKKLFTAQLHYFEGMGELFKQFYFAIEKKQDIPVPMTEALRVTSVIDKIIIACNVEDS
jgi:predicted dehydrogenase